MAVSAVVCFFVTVIILGVSKLLIHFLIEGTFQYNTHHITHNRIDSCAIFDFDVVLFEITAHEFPHCRFLWCVIFPCHNKTSKLSTSILHQFRGLHNLWDTLAQKLDSFISDELIIGLESTAHYGNNLVEFLVKHNYKVCVINPIQTNSMRKNNTRKTKTDKVDTYIIAKTLMMNPHRILYLNHASKGTWSFPYETHKKTHTG